MFFTRVVQPLLVSKSRVMAPSSLCGVGTGEAGIQKAEDQCQGDHEDSRETLHTRVRQYVRQLEDEVAMQYSKYNCSNITCYITIAPKVLCVCVPCALKFGTYQALDHVAVLCFLQVLKLILLQL